MKKLVSTTRFEKSFLKFARRNRSFKTAVDLAIAYGVVKLDDGNLSVTSQIDSPDGATKPT